MRLGTSPLVLLCAGCVVTEVGNPQTDPEPQRDVEIEFTGRSADEPVAVMRQSIDVESGLSIREAWLAFADVEVRSSDSDCDSAEGQRTNQPLVVELVSRSEYPASVQLNPDAAIVCRVELEAGTVSPLPEGVPSELSEFSLLLRGANASGVPFEVRAQVDEDFRIDGPLTVDADSTPFLIAFDLNGWLNADDVESEGAEDLVVVDATTRPDVIEALQDRIEASAELLRDVGADGIED